MDKEGGKHKPKLAKFNTKDPSAPTSPSADFTTTSTTSTQHLQAKLPLLSLRRMRQAERLLAEFSIAGLCNVAWAFVRLGRAVPRSLAQGLAQVGVGCYREMSWMAAPTKGGRIVICSASWLRKSMSNLNQLQYRWRCVFFSHLQTNQHGSAKMMDHHGPSPSTTTIHSKRSARRRWHGEKSWPRRPLAPFCSWMRCAASALGWTSLVGCLF